MMKMKGKRKPNCTSQAQEPIWYLIRGHPSHRNQLLLHVWLESNGERESSSLFGSPSTKQTGDPNDCLETALVPSQPSPSTIQGWWWRGWLKRDERLVFKRVSPSTFTETNPFPVHHLMAHPLKSSPFHDLWRQQTGSPNIFLGWMAFISFIKICWSPLHHDSSWSLLEVGLEHSKG